MEHLASTMLEMSNGFYSNKAILKEIQCQQCICRSLQMKQCVYGPFRRTNEGGVGYFRCYWRFVLVSFLDLAHFDLIGLHALTSYLLVIDPLCVYMIVNKPANQPLFTFQNITRTIG